MLGSDRNQARSGGAIDPRIHLFVRRGLAQGRPLRVSDHADFEYGLFPGLLDVLAHKFARQDILLVLDGAPNHRCGELAVPGNIRLLYLPPYSPELNPKENIWDEIREKIFKNYALKSMDVVQAKLKEAILYMERNPKLVRSITSFPYIVKSL
jgi:transposase